MSHLRSTLSIPSIYRRPHPPHRRQIEKQPKLPTLTTTSPSAD
ncbi:hypothetical protein BIFDEN_00896 [Bifidobacterium dentium ATCC 27678]|nr:hypothetical protein BIFDEN_00896 [Bifidobacterium dentium ATCC 27678]